MRVSDLSYSITSNNLWIDSLVGGGGLYANFNWLLPARNTIYYSYVLDTDKLYRSGETITAYTQLNALQKNSIKTAFDYINSLIGINFLEVNDPSLADIYFANADIKDKSVAASTDVDWYYNYDLITNEISKLNIKQYIYFDSNEYKSINANATYGNYGYELMLHELGHALGLKHPIETPGSTLPSILDNTNNTLMSYTHITEGHTTYSPYDIAALLYLYGTDGVGGNWGYTSTSKMINGTPVNDTISSGSGNNMIDGGDGLDTVKFLKSYKSSITDNFVIKKSTDGNWTITISEKNLPSNPITTSNFVQTMVSVERLEFTDTHLALDLDGNAGVSAKIIGVVFGPQFITNKIYMGIGIGLLDAGWTFDNLAGLALDVAGAKTSDQIVSLLWTNLFSSVSTLADRAPFVSLLESGMQPGVLARLAADTSLNSVNINLIGLAQTGIEYLPIS